MQIPIYDSSGRLMRFSEAEPILEHQHHFRLVRTRRGHLKEAHLRNIESLDSRPTSSLGMAFEQPLSTGHVYALQGVLGSR